MAESEFSVSVNARKSVTPDLLDLPQNGPKCSGMKVCWVMATVLKNNGGRSDGRWMWWVGAERRSWQSSCEAEQEGTWCRCVHIIRTGNQCKRHLDLVCSSATKLNWHLNWIASLAERRFEQKDFPQGSLALEEALRGNCWPPRVKILVFLG